MIKHHTRDTFLTKHHLRPRSRGGSNSPKNLVMIWRDKHDSLHLLFGNSTLDEILQILLKGTKHIGKHVGGKHWILLFGNKNLIEAYRLLKRVQSIKHKATSD